MIKFTNIRVMNFPDAGNITIDPKGFEVPEKVPVVHGNYLDFSNAVGEATLRVSPDGIDADMEIFSHALAGDLNIGGKFYPSVGGVILERTGTKVTKGKLVQILIGPTPNQDFSIHPLPKP